MITLNQKHKIIIAYYLDKKTQCRIVLEVGLNRKTVARYIKDYDQRDHLLARADDTQKEKLTTDIIQAPIYDTSSHKKVKLTTEIVDRIQFYLQENQQKKKEGKHKQQRKKIDIFEALQEKGFAIGYTTICNTIREIQQETREAYIRQEYLPSKSTKIPE